MGLVAREVEKQGISTIMVSLLPEATRELRVPRAIYFPNKLGAPIGKPGDKQEQEQALRLCLAAVTKVQRGEIITAEEVSKS